MRYIDQAAIAELPPQEREEARKLLEALAAQYEANPLLKYEPHPKQQLFHDSKALTKVFMGGNRAGKTTAGILDDIIQAVDRSAVPDHLLSAKKFEPPFHGRIVCPSEAIMESVVFQKFREWCPRGQLVGDSWEKAFSKSQRILRFKNGSYFDFLTYEQDVNKHGGTAKHRVHFDEEPPFELWQEGGMRLLDYRGADRLLTMTPQYGLKWTYDTFWEPFDKNRLDPARIFFIIVDMDENPYLDVDQKREALAGYSSDELKARKEGRYIHLAGMIYSEFSPREHVIPQDNVPKGAFVYVGIDPGMRVMAAVVWTYVTHDDVMVVFDELGLQGYTVEDIARAIKIINTKHGTDGKLIIPRQYVIDPAARNVEQITGRNVQNEFTKHEIYTVLGQNAVSPGINAVKERLDHNRLLVMANCRGLIDEFRRYRWATPSKSENDPKEKPIKQEDHRLDALRYVVQSRPYGPPPPQPVGDQSQVEWLLEQEMKGLNKPRVPRTSGIAI